MRTALSVLAFWLAAPALHALTVTPLNTTDAAALAAQLSAPAMTLLPGTAALQGVDGQSGTFVNGVSAGIGIDSGIILTTGLAENAEPPNAFEQRGSDNASAGDADLNALIPEPTVDAASLSFGFSLATAGTLTFRYVFGSDEYASSAIGLNDVFGLFLDGTNVALTAESAPVSVLNINCGVPVGSGGPSCADFIDNDFLSATQTEYDGFTRVLQAVVDVAAGDHFLKVAIGDAIDGAVDSGVFLDRASFDPIPPAPVPTPGTAALLLLGLGFLVAGRVASRVLQGG